MITEPTVLIVGAGASKPFGFPIGTDLKERICSELLDTKTDVHIIINKYNGSQLQSFVKDLKYSGFYFLGFGFSETNLKRLDYRNWNNLRKCGGTIYGIDAQTKNLLSDIHFGEDELRFVEHEKTCSDFLRSDVVFK